ncbi:MAG TPA: ChbG/HpnK family deacetylase [Thermoanaerobaculia bacterium]|nr:ChbG/HpnK family deacetylase [Thermoanaerobaculia bacterium]
MKTLVVTADDAGLHPGMTLGALKAYDQGIVTAVSVSPNGRAFDHAVERLKDRPKLDVGVHLTLVGERPLSPPETIPSLLGKDGALLPGFPAFVRRALLGKIRWNEVERELRAQIERLQGTGLRVVHANGHQHLHVLPGVFELVHKLADEHGIRWLRIPADPAATRGVSFRHLQLGLLNALGRRARPHVRTADRAIGIVAAGHLTPGKLTRILDDVKGRTELVCHPGIGGAELAAEYDWGYGWDAETAALCDPGVREGLERAGVRVMSFTEMAREGVEEALLR